MTFTRRPLADGATLGDRLRHLRLEAGTSLADLARRVQVAEKYLLAIEETRYADLPGLVYARQFIRRYAEALETDVDAAMKLFETEYPIVAGTAPPKRPLISPRARTEFPWARRHVRFIIAAIIVFAVAVYLGLQAVHNFLPPSLVVTDPARDFSTMVTTITVAGSTDPEASVTINDQDVQITTSGSFSESVDLHPGLNTLKISAIKKHSQARIVTRQVFVEEKTGP